MDFQWETCVSAQSSKLEVSTCNRNIWKLAFKMFKWGKPVPKSSLTSTRMHVQSRVCTYAQLLFN